MAMGFDEMMMGSEAKIEKINKWTPEQMKAFKEFWKTENIKSDPLYQKGNKYLQDLLGGGQGAYDLFENPLMQKYQQDIAPGIAERFAGLGAGSSSGFNQSMARGAENMVGQLGEMRGKLTQNALQQSLQYAQQPYSNQLAGFQMSPYEVVAQGGSPGLIQEGITGLLSNLSLF